MTGKLQRRKPRHLVREFSDEKSICTFLITCAKRDFSHEMWIQLAVPSFLGRTPYEPSDVAKFYILKYKFSGHSVNTFLRILFR